MKQILQFLCLIWQKAGQVGPPVVCVLFLTSAWLRIDGFHWFTSGFLHNIWVVPFPFRGIWCVEWIILTFQHPSWALYFLGRPILWWTNLVASSVCSANPLRNWRDVGGCFGPRHCHTEPIIESSKAGAFYARPMCACVSAGL